MVKSYSCVLCKKSHLKENNRRKIHNTKLKDHVSSLLKRTVTADDAICLQCRAKLLRDIASLCSPKPQWLDDELDDGADFQVTDKNKGFISPKSIQLQLASASKSHRRCVVCKKQSGKRSRLIVVPEDARTQAFVENGLVIGANSRCCPTHLIGDYFKQDDINTITHVCTSTNFNRSDILDLLDRVRGMLKSSGKINFDLPVCLSEDDYTNLTGLTKEQFNIVASFVTCLRSSEVRSTRTCLAILLVKLRTGLPNSIMATIFSLKQHQIQRAVHAARNALMQKFVPSFVGFNHISHSEFINKHTTPIAKQIFATNEDDKAVLVLDGTYVYIQKSSHHQFQKMTYSIHKNRHLVKPMMIVGTDGYILNVIGPYYADGKNNDASIAKHAFATNADEINNWMEEKDVLIVDRGFRDVVDFLNDLNFQVEMPCYLQKGQKQHTTAEANESRLVTKVRWVVESANGRIKQWRFFDKVVPNHYVPYIGDFVRIVCALVNCFRCPLISDFGMDDIGKDMLERAKRENHVQKIVEENNLIRKKSVYEEMNGTSGLQDFPRICLQELRDITMGVYQLKLAPKYAVQHFEDGNYALFSCKDRPNLVKIKLMSRHSSSKIYNLWIEYNDKNVSGWYCTCKVGARIVGCCAHVASVIWYLGYNRWTDNSETCTKGTSSKFSSAITNAQEIPATDTDSDDVDSDDLMEE